MYTVKRCLSLQKSKAEVKRDASQLPSFKPRKRAAKHQLPENPFKILAAPNISTDLYHNVLDWSPSSYPFLTGNIRQKLALAIQDNIYLVDPFSSQDIDTIQLEDAC